MKTGDLVVCTNDDWSMAHRAALRHGLPMPILPVKGCIYTIRMHAALEWKGKNVELVLLDEIVNKCHEMGQGLVKAETRFPARFFRVVERPSIAPIAALLKTRTMGQREKEDDV